MVESRAYVRFLNDGSDQEQGRIEQILANRFKASQMVGHVNVEMTYEPDGWRVTSAWHVGGTWSGAPGSLPPPPAPSDWRGQVIETLREGGIKLAH